MIRKLLPLAVSVAILAVLYLSIDLASLLAVLGATDPLRLGLALMALVALILVTILRLRLISWALGRDITLRVAGEATLVANALNLALPGKLGDLLKSTMLRREGPGSSIAALNLSIYEKGSDLFGVFLWGAAALLVVELGSAAAGLALVTAGLFVILVSPAPARVGLAALHGFMPEIALRLGEDWQVLVTQICRRPLVAASILALTAGIWAGHYVQIGLLVWALDVDGPWLAMAGAIPLVILAGLVPLTVAGVGTRDAAIVLLIGPLIGPEAAAALGILFWLRYLVPGLLGLPLMPRFADSIRELRAKQLRP